MNQGVIIVYYTCIYSINADTIVKTASS